MCCIRISRCSIPRKRIGDHSGVPSCTLLQVPDLPSLAAYYRHLAAVSLGLESGDDVVYAGGWPIWAVVSYTDGSAATKGEHNSYRGQEYLLRNQNSRSWDATKERGCDSCAAGLLLLPEDDYNISRVPADIVHCMMWCKMRLICMIYRIIVMHSRISTLTLTKFENGLVAAGGRALPRSNTRIRRIISICR